MNVAPTPDTELSPFVHIVRGPYTLSSRGLLSDEQATSLVQLLRNTSDAPVHTVLGGRGRALLHDLPSLGRIFVKRYSHGGLLRSLTGGFFLCVGQCRSEAEFEMLERVRSFGVNAPKPYAYVKKGATLYNTWLVMEELLGTRSLVEIHDSEEDTLHRGMQSLAEQIRCLIKHRIFHVDLHPGNVLISAANEAYIVDFDKACVFKGSVRALCELYLRRWRRAVIKHGLSPLLSEMMSLTLRSYND